MRKIDLYSWDRREIYEFFSPLAQPWYSVGFHLDVGGLYRHVKTKGLPFYYAMCYLVTQAVNETEAFLYTLRGGEVFLLDRREPSFTVRRAGEKYFRIVTMPCRGSLTEFCREAAEREKTQDAFIVPESESDALVYLSCLPWMDLTALTNERGDDRDDAIPRIAWGKFVEEGGRLTLGMSVEVNHRFVDGADIGAFVGRLEEKIAELS